MQSNKPLFGSPLFISAVVLLVMNFMLFSRIGDMNREMERLNRNYNNLQTQISSISGNVDQALNRFTRDQNWISPVQVNEEKTRGVKDQGLVTLNWQIKDYLDRAQVAFHYRESEASEFITLPAENKGDGFFEVTIPLEAKVEPFWDIHVSKTESQSGRKNADTKTMIAESAAMVRDNGKTVSCYVSMKTKDTIKSGELTYFDLAYLAHEKYEPIQGHIDVRNNKYYNITLFGNHGGSNDLVSVRARFYEGNTMLAVRVLETQATKNGAQTHSLNYEADSQNISRLVIQADFRNGNSFEKEINL